MIGEIDKNAELSGYQASDEVVAFTKAAQYDYFLGHQILHRPYLELNNRSIIDDENRGEMMFNAFVDTEVEDPQEAWKWRGTRSMARNKGIAMHANLTSNYILPTFEAQNDEDQVDQDFSEVMRDIIEWMADPTNSNYQSSFLQTVMGMLTSPVTFLGAEYFEVYQKIRERQEDGTYQTKEVIDEILSGFQAPVWDASQILITNAYERNIQKQKRIWKRRYVDKNELQAKYGEHPNWQFVQTGVRSIINQEDGLFYDVKDKSRADRNIVSEEICLTRRDDSEVPFVNGVYLGNMDSIEDNPINHRDNRGAPKYNVIPFGYSRIGKHFFYYKSMMNVMGWDNMLYDAQNEVFMNRALLEAEMPIAVSGAAADKVDSDIVFPNSVTVFESENTKVTPLLPGSNLPALQGAIRATEDSMSDAAVSDTTGGNLPDGNQKAYSVAQAGVAAKKIISSVGKSIAESVVKYGDLMKDIAINHITIPQVDELVGGDLKLKYKSFMVTKSGAGKSTARHIKFDASLIGAEMTKDDKESEAIRLLEAAGYPTDTKSLLRVNPELFARFKYLTRADAEDMFSKNSDYWQPVLLNLKTALAQDPTIDQSKLSKKLMYSYFKSEGDEMVVKAPAQQPQKFSGPTAGGGAPGNAFGAQVQNKLLSTASQSAAQ